MDHYSAWADLLSKFQGSPPWIQALWLVLTAGVALGAMWCVADVVKHTVATLARRPRGRVVYGLVQDEDGRWVVWVEGEARAVGHLAEARRVTAAIELSPGTCLPTRLGDAPT